MRRLSAMRASGATLAELCADLTLFPQKLVNVRVQQRVDVMRAPAVQKAVSEVEAKLAGQGVLEFRQGDQPIKDPATIRQILEVAVPQCLDRLAKLALLEA